VTRAGEVAVTPRRVRRTARLARRLMPPDGDLDQWLRNLSEQRMRPIRAAAGDLSATPGLTGMCVIRDDADYIVVDAAASPARQVMFLCHEVAHLLLGHQGEVASSDLIARATPDLPPGLRTRVLTRHEHSSPEEHAAEELATLLSLEHARRQRAQELRVNAISARLR
jgi:hypothetical protein